MPVDSLEILTSPDIFSRQRQLRRNEWVSAGNDPSVEAFLNSVCTDGLARQNQNGQFKIGDPTTTNTLRQGKVKKWWAGGWLEEATYSLVCEIKELCRVDGQECIQDVILNRHFTRFSWLRDSNQDKNPWGEFDVAALAVGRLLLFECKDWDVTWKDRDGKYKEKLDQFKREVDKVANQRKNLGGAYCCAYLVTPWLDRQLTGFEEDIEERRERIAEIRDYCMALEVTLIQLPVLERSKLIEYFAGCVRPVLRRPRSTMEE